MIHSNQHYKNYALISNTERALFKSAYKIFVVKKRKQGILEKTIDKHVSKYC